MQTPLNQPDLNLQSLIHLNDNPRIQVSCCCRPVVAMGLNTDAAFDDVLQSNVPLVMTSHALRFHRAVQNQANACRASRGEAHDAVTQVSKQSGPEHKAVDIRVAATNADTYRAGVMDNHKEGDGSHVQQEDVSEGLQQNLETHDAESAQVWMGDCSASMHVFGSCQNACSMHLCGFWRFWRFLPTWHVPATT
jgi:hypothetical protein